VLDESPSREITDPRRLLEINRANLKRLEKDALEGIVENELCSNNFRGLAYELLNKPKDSGMMFTRRKQV
jgi:hypothetical protein